MRKKKRTDALPPTAALNTHQEQGRRYITPPEIIDELGQSIDIHTLLAQQIRKIREQRGLRQDDLALLSWDFGLDWQQDTVAAIESGRRKLSLEEFLLLRPLLECGYQDLFPEDCAVVLNPEIAIDSRYWDVPHHQWPPLRRKERELTVTPGGISLYQPERRDALRDAEIKAARKLGVDGHVIVETAQKLWHRSLPDERDVRLRSHIVFTGLVKRTIVDERRMLQVAVLDNEREKIGTIERRTLQALRGHITRQLLEELRKEIKRNMTAKSKQRRKKR